MNVLVTGGAGYIGSHTVLKLLENNFNVIIIDDFSNSDPEVIKILEKISNKKVIIYRGDIRNQIFLQKLFQSRKIDAVIHFAGLKSVEESIKDPIKYFETNVLGTINLLVKMEKFNIKKLVFSSSATVYGNQTPPFVEDMVHGNAANTYAKTKMMIEDMLFTTTKINSVILRYFNPIGAHTSGLLGENPHGKPNNLMPYLVNVALGKYEILNVFGNDYPTKDGSCIRDFIHVEDLAIGHIHALKYICKNKGTHVFNLGTGKGISVFELINKFEEVNKIKINFKISPRRPGDISKSFACCKKAENQLLWKTKFNIEDMCRDSWNFGKMKFK